MRVMTLTSPTAIKISGFSALKKRSYVKPAIIYQGVIQARAGSPLMDPFAYDPFDPANLFDGK